MQFNCDAYFCCFPCKLLLNLFRQPNKKATNPVDLATENPLLSYGTTNWFCNCRWKLFFFFLFNKSDNKDCCIFTKKRKKKIVSFHNKNGDDTHPARKYVLHYFLLLCIGGVYRCWNHKEPEVLIAVYTTLCAAQAKIGKHEC